MQSLFSDAGGEQKSAKMSYKISLFENFPSRVVVAAHLFHAMEILCNNILKCKQKTRGGRKSVALNLIFMFMKLLYLLLLLITFLYYNLCMVV